MDNSVCFGLLLVACLICSLSLVSAQDYDDESNNDMEVDKRSMNPSYYFNAGPPRKISGYGKRAYKSFSNPMKGFGNQRYSKRYAPFSSTYPAYYTGVYGRPRMVKV